MTLLLSPIYLLLHEDGTVSVALPFSCAHSEPSSPLSEVSRTYTHSTIASKRKQTNKHTHTLRICYEVRIQFPYPKREVITRQPLHILHVCCSTNESPSLLQPIP